MSENESQNIGSDQAAANNAQQAAQPWQATPSIPQVAGGGWAAPQIGQPSNSSAWVNPTPASPYAAPGQMPSDPYQQTGQSSQPWQSDSQVSNWQMPALDQSPLAATNAPTSAQPATQPWSPSPAVPMDSAAPAASSLPNSYGQQDSTTGSSAADQASIQSNQSNQSSQLNQPYQSAQFQPSSYQSDAYLASGLEPSSPAPAAVPSNPLAESKPEDQQSYSIPATAAPATPAESSNTYSDNAAYFGAYANQLETHANSADVASKQPRRAESEPKQGASVEQVSNYGQPSATPASYQPEQTQSSQPQQSQFANPATTQPAYGVTYDSYQPVQNQAPDMQAAQTPGPSADNAASMTAPALAAQYGQDANAQQANVQQSNAQQSNAQQTNIQQTNVQPVNAQAAQPQQGFQAGQQPNQQQPYSGQLNGQQPAAQPAYGQPAYGQMQPGHPVQGAYGQQIPQQNVQQAMYMDPNAAPEAARKPHSKLVAGLLGIILGAFGIQNFYLGNTGRGMAQLMISCIGAFFFFIGPAVSWAWGIVEGILILTSKPGSARHQDAYGIELTD
ncbi:hypothetical protein KIMH_03670 [Bombiscardovia apis]|uniref:TM2 domain-containing protein n=1 Tax=Bombiscardovia apis TaxID=2932182 RepID=A0ABM8BBQ3_9BIFI|nr:NINE protein [Bombiscardovia apis]BDR54256.1 hypothetical protein KIMH_03670 [Bombiscardovia apis]